MTNVPCCDTVIMILNPTNQSCIWPPERRREMTRQLSLPQRPGQRLLCSLPLTRERRRGWERSPLWAMFRNVAGIHVLLPDDVHEKVTKMSRVHLNSAAPERSSIPNAKGHPQRTLTLLYPNRTHVWGASGQIHRAVEPLFRFNLKSLYIG